MAKQTNCRGRKHGWPFCPFVLSGTFAQPFYKLERKLTEEGNPKAREVGLELAEFMILLDKLFFTRDRDALTLEALPGVELYEDEIKKEGWEGEDCYCNPRSEMPEFKEGELERLTALWTKSRLLKD